METLIPKTKRKKAVYSPECLQKKREAIKKTHEFNRGRKLTEEHKANLSKNHVGRTGKKLSKEHKQKLQEGFKKSGFKRKNPISEEHKKAISKANSNPSMETRIRKSKANKKRVNDGTHHFWKGGKTAESKKIRESFQYKLWRTAVFERDNYTCIFCFKRGGDLNADHIKPFSIYPELRFAIDNGRTLCHNCHMKTDTYGGNSIKNKIK